MSKVLFNLNSGVGPSVDKDFVDPARSGQRERTTTMRHERLFSKGGYYSFIVESNVLMHREAVTHGYRTLSSWVKKMHSASRPVRILDLACGGEPISIADIMSRIPKVEFDYTGIDINPDQVEQAKGYNGFSPNVKRVTIHDGNAWDEGLRSFGVGERFDVIYSGMNFHHGNVVELYYMARLLFALLIKGGLVFSHDEYRPVKYDYVARPDVNPRDDGESFRLVSPGSLEGVEFPDLQITGQQFPHCIADWRLDFIGLLRRYLKDHHADHNYIEQTANHAYQRDFPVSTKEVEKIFQAAGFVTRNITEPSGHLLEDFFAFVVMEK